MAQLNDWFWILPRNCFDYSCQSMSLYSVVMHSQMQYMDQYSIAVSYDLDQCSGIFDTIFSSR